MTNKEIKKYVQSFQKEYKLTEINYRTLRKACEEMGYTVIEFNHIFNEKDVQTLITSLNLDDCIKQSRGFTYANENYRMVFIHEDLSDEEKNIVLAHEAGHIFLGHLNTVPVLGKDVKEEFEANEFVHFLLCKSRLKNCKAFVRKHKAAVIIAASVIVLAVAGTVIFANISENSKYYGDYYITTTAGHNYHLKDCSYVKNKSNTRRLTKEDFESGKYSPCDVCQK